MSELEKPIENSILNFLKIIGIFAWKVDRQGTYDPVRKVFRTNKNPNKIKGVSDILGIYNGRMLAIEVKSPKGTITPEQRVFIARINEEGGIAFVARSLNQAIESLLPHMKDNARMRQFAAKYLETEGKSPAGFDN